MELTTEQTERVKKLISISIEYICHKEGITTEECLTAISSNPAIGRNLTMKLSAYIECAMKDSEILSYIEEGV